MKIKRIARRKRRNITFAQSITIEGRPLLTDITFRPLSLRADASVVSEARLEQAIQTFPTPFKASFSSMHLVTHRYR